ISGSWDRTIRVWNINNGNVSPCKLKFPLVTKMFLAIDNGYRSDSIIENGWILNQLSELLFWVPPWSENGLLRPNNVMVIGKGSTKVDLSHFVHGKNWHQCQDPF